MNSKVWKAATALLACCCAALGYCVLDQGITRTYLDASMKGCATHSTSLAGLVEHEWSGLTEDQLMVKLKAYTALQTNETMVWKGEPEEHVIYLEDVRFEFKDGKLVKVM